MSRAAAVPAAGQDLSVPVGAAGVSPAAVSVLRRYWRSASHDARERRWCQCLNNSALGVFAQATYEGLGTAVQSVTGGDLAFVADNDPDASKLLAYRFPDVPNLGDIKAVDWASLGTVDILCGGFPCQPFSAAGRRLGAADERHLWPYIAEAVAVLRPPLVVLENVYGHLTLGFDIVLADLAGLGYDAEWIVVTASASGACHRRARLFILASPARSQPVAGVPAAVIRGGAWLEPCESLFGALPFTGRIPASGRMTAGRIYAAEDALTAVTAGLLKTPTAQLAVNGGSQHPDKRRAGGHGPTLADQVEHELLPTPTVADSRNSRNAAAGRLPTSTGHPGMTLSDVFWDENPGGALLPTPSAGNFNDGEDLASWEARRQRNLAKGVNGNGQGTPLPIAAQQIAGAVDWGPYEAAIRRWEAVTGRPAPRPTVPGKTGERLNPALPEFMMGLPAGWITEVPGLSRNAQLRLAGNGVVAAQAELALRLLLDRASPVPAELGGAA